MSLHLVFREIGEVDTAPTQVAVRPETEQEESRCVLDRVNKKVQQYPR